MLTGTPAPRNAFAEYQAQRRPPMNSLGALYQRYQG